jgi:hypothetical protein
VRTQDRYLPPSRAGAALQRGEEVITMRTYYLKLSRHLLSMAVLTGFLAGNN